MPRTTVTRLDRDARYTVRGWDGIAFFVYGFPRRWEAYMYYGECTDPFCDCHTNEDALHSIETGEGEWVEQDETCGRVIVVMVGDDRKHEVRIDELTKLGELDYCSECGQVGCRHDGRERDAEPVNAGKTTGKTAG